MRASILCLVFACGLCCCDSTRAGGGTNDGGTTGGGTTGGATTGGRQGVPDSAAVSPIQDKPNKWCTALAPQGWTVPSTTLGYPNPGNHCIGQSIDFANADRSEAASWGIFLVNNDCNGVLPSGDTYSSCKEFCLKTQPSACQDQYGENGLGTPITVLKYIADVGMEQYWRDPGHIQLTSVPTYNGSYAYVFLASASGQHKGLAIFQVLDATTLAPRPFDEVRDGESYFLSIRSVGLASQQWDADWQKVAQITASVKCDFPPATDCSSGQGRSSSSDSGPDDNKGYNQQLGTQDLCDPATGQNYSATQEQYWNDCNACLGCDGPGYYKVNGNDCTKLALGRCSGT